VSMDNQSSTEVGPTCRTICNVAVCKDEGSKPLNTDDILQNHLKSNTSPPKKKRKFPNSQLALRMRLCVYVSEIGRMEIG
jgi:hypothetical protein